ncbi:hypothetical protein TKK_0004665 [Trichogramma kaykai]
MQQTIRIDAKDNSGSTPLRLAVASLSPDMIVTLLGRGADLSSFVFLTKEQFKGGSKDSGLENLKDYLKLKRTFNALIVVEFLKKRGYELQREDALTIMKVFAEIGSFEKTPDTGKSWCDNEVADALKRIIMSDDPLLVSRSFLKYIYTPVQLKLNEAKISQTHRNSCITKLCNKMTREFLRQWRLEFFFTLTHCQLPILCCEKIMQELSNKDLFHVCMATEKI